MNQHILLVEDDALLGKLIETKLTSLGYRVEWTHDGLEAVTAIEKEKPDLMLLDIIMPKLNGYETLEQLEQKGMSVPTIMLTNLGQEEDVAKAIMLGARGYILKAESSPDSIAQKVTETLLALGFSTPEVKAPDETKPTEEKTTDVVEEEKTSTAPVIEPLYPAGFLTREPEVSTPTQTVSPLPVTDTLQMPVTIPAAPVIPLVPVPVPVAPPATTPPAATEQPLLLIIEDDAFLRELLTIKLSKDFRLSSAHDASTALFEVKKSCPDAILLDIMLPGVDGFEVLKMLRERKLCSSSPIIMITNFNGDQDKERALRLGADAYLVKANLDIVTFPAFVHGLIEQKRTAVC